MQAQPHFVPKQPYLTLAQERQPLPTLAQGTQPNLAQPSPSAKEQKAPSQGLSIPQLTGHMVVPPAQQQEHVYQIKQPSPNITSIPPLTVEKKISVQEGQVVDTTLDVESILSKMPGISVTAITPPPSQVPADINDIIQKEDAENDDDFEARRRLTLLLASIPDYRLNNATAVTAGHIMMKKSKLGVTYDSDVESAIAYLVALLQR